MSFVSVNDNCSMILLYKIQPFLGDLWRAVFRAFGRAGAVPYVGSTLLEGAQGPFSRGGERDRPAEPGLHFDCMQVRSLLDSSRDGIAVLDQDKRILFLNSSAQRLLGRTAGELEDRAFFSLLSGDACARADVLFALADVEEINSSHEPERVMISRSGGGEIPIEIQISRAIDGERRLYAVLLRDITELLKSEHQNALLAALVQSSMDAIISFSPDRRVVSWNEGASKLFGYTAEEAIGAPADLLVPPGFGHGPSWYFERVFDGACFAGESKRRRKDGCIIDVYLSIAPIRAAAGETIGISAIIHDLSGRKEEEARLRQVEDNLQRLAHHDALTNLPNRNQLVPAVESAIARAKSSGKLGSVLFVDLDRFKIINECLGQSAGDAILLKVVERLKETVGMDCTIARYGGDEFVVVLEGLDRREDAGQAAQRIIAKLIEPVAKEQGGEVYLGASIGISIFPEDGDDASRAIQNADTALYAAKVAGRGCYRFYEVALTKASNARLDVHARMRRALEKEEFYLEFQPLVAFSTGEVRGVEALVRWRDPVQGLVSPSEFIPIAEDTGLIINLGDWVLAAACRQMRAWRDAGIVLSTMAVNLSPRQFEQSNFVERLQKVLSETGLDPRYLELEITEGALMSDGESVRAKLQAIKETGVKLAIDDFGTGYSSLSYLRRFPIDKLKVDRSFVMDIGTDKTAGDVVAAIIGLGKNLGLEVLAEGVETEEQAAFLKAQGCDTAQGYLFSKSLPAERAARFLTSRAAPVRLPVRLSA